MTSTPPSPSATEQRSPTTDPLLARRQRSLRFWWVLVALTTALAIVVTFLAWWLARQEPWTPIPIPTGVPS
ncbi:hypothetical protein [Enemella dayhoffiae]|uniref:hypothetical protein n=1 Tax=Enemella dayhoffiae TaxID=2016507 RepID=UPI00113FCEB0|nr:hypothetical protein [Enemella dayhoffiae]